MKRFLVAVVLVVGVVLGACAPVPTRPSFLPATPLDGWTTIGRASVGFQAGKLGVDLSPNTQFLVWRNHDLSTYMLDRGTGTGHLVVPEQVMVLDVSDDGAVLVSYPREGEEPIQHALYTVSGGLVPFTLPTSPTDCDLGFETGGPGYSLECDATESQALGLYRFDGGDVTATPVFVVEGLLPEQRLLESISPNQRYVEIMDEVPLDHPCRQQAFGYCPPLKHWVHDRQTATTFPFPYADTTSCVVLFPVGCVHRPRAARPVADDGRILFTEVLWGLNLEHSRMMWFDPRFGTKEPLGFPELFPARFFEGSSYFSYEDFTVEIGHHYIFEQRRNNPDTLPILGNLTSPTARWLLPGRAYQVLGVSPDGDVLMTTTPTTEPGELRPMHNIIVREGPLP